MYGPQVRALVTKSAVTMNKNKVDKTKCCVHGCHTRRANDKETSFHYFPPRNSCKVQITNIFGGKESIDRRKAWEKVLLLRKPAKRHMRVCGKHFLREDFINRKFHEFEVKSL
jgi:hypothetical protein